MTRTPPDRHETPAAAQADTAAPTPPALRLDQIDLETPPHGVPRWEPEDGDFT